MSRRRVYILPFLPSGVYAATWIDVTKDVVQDSLGAIQLKLDVSDYDIGVYTNSSIALALKNNTGVYSDVGNISSIFGYKRSDSLVKITWDLADTDYTAGVSTSYDIQGHETTIFEGLLNDDSTVMQLADQDISFNILGLETIFDRVLAPNWVSSPPVDNKCSTLIKALLAAANAGITQPVFSIDNAQIVPANDVLFDDLSVFANKTCKEALDSLLLASNSVLYMGGTSLTTPIVSGRTPSATVLKTFYGPGSVLGPENILDIQDIRTGLNRTFNFVTWTGTALFSQDATSVAQYGIRKKEIQIAGLTNSTKQQSVLDALRTEFASPKQEFKLITPITYDVLALPLLAKISIDFPLVSIGTTLPLYEVAQYEVDSYPAEISSFQILTSETYKVLGVDVDTVANNATFYLRRI